MFYDLPNVDVGDTLWVPCSNFPLDLNDYIMKAVYQNKEQKEQLIELLNTELKKHFEYVSLQSVVKIANSLIEKGVRIE